MRDEEGVVVAAMSRKLDYPLEALAIEAKALEIGVTFAEDVGLRDIIFEGDSQLFSMLSMVLERLRYRF